MSVDGELPDRVGGRREDVDRGADKPGVPTLVGWKSASARPVSV